MKTEISEYWQRQGLIIDDRTIGRTWTRSNGEKMCNECCNGDRCDDASHSLRPYCRACLGTAYNLSCDVTT